MEYFILVNRPIFIRESNLKIVPLEGKHTHVVIRNILQNGIEEKKWYFPTEHKFFVKILTYQNMPIACM